MQLTAGAIGTILRAKAAESEARKAQAAAAPEAVAHQADREMMGRSLV
jgi:hypothetical protein